VERSFDGIHFESIATTGGALASSLEQSITYDDHLNNSQQKNIYYRIKITGTNTRQRYTNIILLKQAEKGISTLQVMPNPVISYFNALVQTDQNCMGKLQLINEEGKILFEKEEKIFKGTNTVLFQNLENYAAGIYFIKVKLLSETLVSKLIIKK
jgi:hypothetical protein